MSHLQYKTQSIEKIREVLRGIIFDTQTKKEQLAQLKALFEGVWVDDLPIDVDYKLALKVELIIRFGQYFFTEFFPVAQADFHREVLANLLEKPRFVIAAPREHAKSTTVSFLFVMYCIAYDRKRFILLTSDTTSQAENFLTDIKSELESNEDFVQMFGQQVGDRWTTGDLITKKGVRILAKGAGTGLRGVRTKESRPDLVICDDMENDELVNTLAQRDKLYNWFNKVLVNVTGRDGQIAYIGTVLHYDSLLERLLKEKAADDRWYTKKYQAEWVENGVKMVLWPEWWSIERLLMRRNDIGEYAYQSEFLNNPIDDNTAIVKRQWVLDNVFTPDQLPRDDKGELRIKAVFGAIDPAISKQDTADFSAIVTIYLGYDGYIWVVSADQRHLSLNEQVNWICDLHEQNDYDEFGIETVAYQLGLKQEVDRVSRERNVYVPTKRLIPVRDKVARAQVLSAYFEQGIIKIRKDLEALINQLLVFPKGDHDDLVDALVYAVSMASPSKKRNRVFAQKPQGF